MSSKSRSRSRSSSRSPKRYRRNNRDDSMSPIRTASGASLRTPKNYNSGGYGYRNFNYRGGYNNRGFHNQRYNYGRWNRGRGNYRGGWQNRNQWNYRNRYNSRSDRSRSRSRSRSYDRDRSRSSSYSRSRSRSRSQSRDKDRRRRSRSAKSNERRTDRPKSKSKSKSPPKVVEMPKETAQVEKPKQEPPPPANIEVPSTIPEPEEQKQPEEPHFAETAAFTRSRWESPDVAGREQQISDMDLEQDQIFDQWDDDKLREYLLKSKGKKLGKEAKKLMEGTNEPLAEVESAKIPTKQKKKKRSKSNTKSPSKETRGRKKKRASKQNRSSSESSSSSSSFSPIHKAPQPPSNIKPEAEPVIPNEPSIQQNQDYTQSAPIVYAPQQAYSASSERTQAVQYPFSHIRKPTPPVSAPVEPAPLPPAPAVSYPAPVPAPQPPPPQPSAPPPPTIGEMQVLGPDGRPMRLVPTSVPGPDGKMIQVMQVVQDTPPLPPPQVSAPPPLPVTKPKQEYRTPPPPPSYPPPPGIGKYSTPAAGGTSATTEMYKPEGFTDDDTPRSSYGHQGLQTHQPTLPTAHMKEEPRHEKQPYEPSNHTLSLKKMEMVEKQKRRQDVVKTRFTPRPAGSWAQEVKQEKEEVKPKESSNGGKIMQKEERGHAIPSLADPANRAKRPTHEEFIPNFPPDGNDIDMMSGRQEKKALHVPSQKMKGPAMMQSGVSQSIAQNQPAKSIETSIQHVTSYPNVPPPSYSQAFNPMQGNQQYFMGASGERLQMPPAKPPPPAVPAPPPPVQKPMEAFQSEKHSLPKPGLQPGWGTAPALVMHKKEKPDVERDMSSEEEDENFGATQRKRTISAGSDKKSKKKLKSVSSDESEDEEQTKRKKEKKKKKKNKKKKDQGNDEAPGKEKKKKKEKKQKEKTEMISLEHETIKSKKDIKAFEDVMKKSKEDDLIRMVSDDLPLSHIRAMVPRRKEEAAEPLLRYVKVEPLSAKTNLATSTSYEDRFVSLFGSGETDVKTEEQEERIDLSKKSVRKFKVHVKGPRDVTHMTKLTLSERIRQVSESENVDDEKDSQKVSMNVSSLSKASQSTQSQSVSRSRSRSRSSSASSDSPKKSKKSKKKKRRSRSSSRSRSRSKSRSRSVSLPRAYAGRDDKAGKRRSRSKDYSDDDLRHDLDKRKAARNRSDSRSRSRSYSSDEGRNRNRGRQMYQNRNNQGYYYNNRGRGRGYFQNYRGGRGWYNNRGNFRGRWNNWNNQGWNRNQGHRYGRYDSRDRYRDRSRDRSRSRSRSRDDRSSSRERDGKRDRNDDSPKKDKQDQQLGTAVQEQAPPASNGKPARQPSPTQWGHDMFEEHEAGDKKE